MPPKDIETKRAIARRHYANNGERVRAKARKQKEMYKKSTRLAINAYKENHPCSDCSQHYPFYVMEFDHVPERGAKFMDISKMLSLQYALERILEEIEKCDVVCSNCHRVRTFSTRSSPATKRCIPKSEPDG